MTALSVDRVHEVGRAVLARVLVGEPARLDTIPSSTFSRELAAVWSAATTLLRADGEVDVLALAGAANLDPIAVAALVGADERLLIPNAQAGIDKLAEYLRRSEVARLAETFRERFLDGDGEATWTALLDAHDKLDALRGKDTGPRIHARTAGSITPDDHKPTKWIVPGVGEGRITLVYGPPSGGKTMAAYDLAIAAVTGQSQLGKFPFDRPLKVYLIEQELVSDDAWHLADRFARGAGTTLAEIGDRLRIYAKDGFDSSDPADVADLLADMELDPPDIVIVDSVNEVWLGSGDQNVGTDVRGWYHRFPEAIRKAFPTAAILLIHHSTKAAFARVQTSENLAHAAGSVQFIACCDAALYVRADAKNKHHHVVSYERVRGCGVGALVYRLVYDLNRPGGPESCPMYALFQNELTDDEATAAVRPPTMIDKAAEIILAGKGSEFTDEEIAARVGSKDPRYIRTELVKRRGIAYRPPVGQSKGALYATPEVTR